MRIITLCAALVICSAGARAASPEYEAELARNWTHLHSGMTEKEIMLAWGAPDHVNTTVTTMGSIHEQWIYPYHTEYYLYFEDSRLVSFQRRN
jgi:hypothetical protein